MDDTLKLIKVVTTGRDAEGNPIVTKTMRQVFCKVQGVTRSEFYSAATADLTPELEITISNRIDYEDEKLALYRGSFYDIIRAYWKTDEVTLTLAKSAGTEGVSE